MGQKLTCPQKKRPNADDLPETETFHGPVTDVEAPVPTPAPSPEPAPAPSPDPPRRNTHVSFAAVDEIVDDFMSDSAINNPLMPDFIERSIYRNVLKLMLGILGRMLDTTELSFLGHNITMKLTPEEEQTTQHELPA